MSDHSVQPEAVADRSIKASDRSWLDHPATVGLDLDHPDTTVLRRSIIRDKLLLRHIYRTWYRKLINDIDSPTRDAGGRGVLELGSGAGFMRELLPEAITSDIMPLPGVDAVIDAHRLPMREAQLAAIVMVNVLHHLADVETFLNEAARAVRPGGVCSMIEPWNSRWSGWVYRNLHHEPFDPSGGWRLSGAGPLSDANGALPWILFARDREKFAERLPLWRIERIEPLMPLAYLLSGGVSKRNLSPGPLRWVSLAMDRLAGGWNRKSNGMFVHVTLRRRQGPSTAECESAKPT